MDTNYYPPNRHRLYNLINRPQQPAAVYRCC